MASDTVTAGCQTPCADWRGGTEAVPEGLRGPTDRGPPAPEGLWPPPERGLFGRGRGRSAASTAWNRRGDGRDGGGRVTALPIARACSAAGLSRVGRTVTQRQRGLGGADVAVAGGDRLGSEAARY